MALPPHTTLSPCFATFTPSSSSSSSLLKLTPHFAPSPKRFVSSSSLRFAHPNPRLPRTKEPCQVYVCNLPRSCNASHLLDMFKPHGTILSVEVCRNAETGESMGCGYITMGSISSARNAIAALDGSDVGGREILVERMNSSPKRVFYYQGPHQLYVGNLARTVRPEELRSLFSRFGNVVSARVLHDHKQGEMKSRVYAILSFQSEAERDAAMSLNGTEFYGRTLLVREGVKRTEPSLEL